MGVWWGCLGMERGWHGGTIRVGWGFALGAFVAWGGGGVDRVWGGDESSSWRVGFHEGLGW